MLKIQNTLDTSMQNKQTMRFDPSKAGKEQQEDMIFIHEEKDNTERIVDSTDTTPYAFETTSKEMADWEELETEFGQDWSSLFTFAYLESKFQENESDGCQHNTNNKRRRPSNLETMSESTEVKKMRNNLWKQSLKRSMFGSAKQQLNVQLMVNAA